jgi:hypothetical protein
MLVHAWLDAGPEITIAWRTAAGLEAGKTPVKYKGVTVGEVKAVALGADGANAVVTVALDKSAAGLARRDTRFWVVRPRVGTGGVSGLDTLLSGAYIAADAGAAQETASAFTGLAAPPTVIAGMPGRSFTSTRTISARWTSARPSTTGTSRWATWPATASTTTARACACRSSSTRPTTASSPPTRASGTPAASTCPSARTG